jgi:hypothetical protein
MPIFICDVCCKEFKTRQALGGHKSGSHKTNRYASKKVLKPKIENEVKKCTYCDKKCKNSNSFRNHERCCPSNPDRNYKNGMIGKKGSNQYLRAEALGLPKPEITEETRKKMSEISLLRGPPSEETRRKISEKLSINNKGGRSKWYTVNGIKVQGTWEREVAKILTEKEIKWIKPTSSNHSFEYRKEDKTKTYTPDFYLEEYDLYLEIKGYWWGNDREKMDCVLMQNPNANIKIIEKEEYEKIIMDGELVW